MGKPLSEDEKKQLAQFLLGIARGTADLGWGSIGMIGLYNRAAEHRLSIVSILTSDADLMMEIANGLKDRAAKLPSSVVQVLKHVILAAEQAQQVPTGIDRGARRAAPDGGREDDDEDV